ncbi:hypothetical protein Gogos_009288 [Gossypium gossypioides]|uniref:DUF4283 domain-containing protein n=1 Tax=Gossypium gossypioides TaxID=34282 RepID=A0A7J9CF84_GOSGO|nr:hypothetical protein [Gossypium gossypioides]
MENKMVDLCIMEEKDEHPLEGIQISNLVEMRFLFQFFHRVDIDRVVKGAPWTFHNHLVVFHRLEDKEDPMEVNESDMGWDMSLCAVGRRVATMESIWLRKGNNGGSSGDVNIVLGINLERAGRGGKGCNLGRMGLDPMRHDLEDNPIDGFDGNKRKITATFSRRVSECSDSSEERDEHLLACQSNVSVTAKRQTVRRLQHMLRLYNPQIMLFMETKLDQNRTERVQMKGDFVCGIEVVADGSKRDLVWVGDQSSVGNVPQRLTMLYRGLKVWAGCLRRLKGGRLRRLRDRVITLDEGDRDEENLSNLLGTKLEKDSEIDKEEFY